MFFLFAVAAWKLTIDSFHTAVNIGLKNPLEWSMGEEETAENGVDFRDFQF